MHFMLALLSTSVGECPPGHSYNSTTESCDPCMLGYFKADRGPGKCAPCPSGMFTRTRGATECECEYTHLCMHLPVPRPVCVCACARMSTLVNFICRLIIIMHFI